MDSLPILLAVVIVFLAFGAFSIFLTKRKKRDPALALFGLFALLYGIRLALDTDIVPFVFDLPERLPVWSISFITYLLPFVGVLLTQSAITSRGPLFRRFLIPSTAAFAIVGPLADLITGVPQRLHNVNNFLIVGLCVIFAFFLVREHRIHSQPPSLIWGLSIFAGCIVLGNLRGLNLVHLSFNPEPVGSVFLLAAVARFLILRTLHNEEQLREIGKELEIATRIQQSILPRDTPPSDALRIAARYHPMTAVAGDFYEFLIVDPDHIGILIADVSGHGVPAALIASMVKVAIAGQMPHAHDPARVLGGMNQTLCGKLQGQFVSAAYLFLDLQNRAWRYGAGGHPPLLRLMPTDANRIEAIEENGLLLGILSRAAYTAVEGKLSPGDRFLLYTDGLIEASNAQGEFFGEERLRSLLEQSHTDSPANVADTLIARLRAFAGYNNGRTQEDDLTVIVIDVT